MKRIVLLTSVSTILIFATAHGLWLGILAFDRALDPFDDVMFTQEAWAVADDRERAAMARDALRHVPRGMTEDEVRQLLGEGNTGGVYGHTTAPKVWTYALGSWGNIGWYGLDDAFFVVHFDANGHVRRVEITGY